MSDAHKRIWVGAAWWTADPTEYQKKYSTEYIRADLAGLPEDLVFRAYKARGGWDGGRVTGQALDAVLHEILAWHEQQKGEKE